MEYIDWFILCHCCCIACRHNPRPKAQLSGYFGILPWEHLRDLRQPKWTKWIDCGQATSILSTEICRLGKLTLVIGPAHQSIGCLDDNVIKGFCISVHLGCTVPKLFSCNASEGPCNACRVRRHRFQGDQPIFVLSTSFRLPLHGCSPHLSI